MREQLKKSYPTEIFNGNSILDNNIQMYIPRSHLESKIHQKLNSNTNGIIQGQSGTGKSWLARRVLKTSGNYHRFIDLNEIYNHTNLSTYFKEKLIYYKWRFDTTKNDDLYYHEQFIEFMKNKSRLKNRHSGQDINKRCFLIFEHFESIINNNLLLKDLLYFIGLINSANRSNLHVILLSSYSNTLNLINTINSELNINLNIIKFCEVSNFTYKESYELIQRGFKKMNINFIKSKLRSKALYYISLKAYNNPKELHKLCSIIAFKSYKNQNVLTQNLLDEAISEYDKLNSNDTSKSYIYL